jgi:hypothetical protein
MAFLESIVCLFMVCSAAPTEQAAERDRMDRDAAGVNLGHQLTASLPYGQRWLRANPWYVGEGPIDQIVQVPAQAGEVWNPPPSMRIAYSNAQVGRLLSGWYDTAGGAANDMARSGIGLPKVHQSIVDEDGWSTNPNRSYRIGFVRGSQLVSEHKADSYPLPSNVNTPVGADSLMLQARIGGATGCGVQPVGGVYGSSTPSQRFHFDAWEKVTACVAIPITLPSGVKTYKYRKTVEYQGCNVTDVFLPTIGQLSSTTIFPGGLAAANPKPPASAPQTNPSTFDVADCDGNVTNGYEKHIEQTKPCNPDVKNDFEGRRMRHLKFNAAGIITEETFTPIGNGVWTGTWERLSNPGSCYTPPPPAGCWYWWWQEPSNGEGVWVQGWTRLQVGIAYGNPPTYWCPGYTPVPGLPNNGGGGGGGGEGAEGSSEGYDTNGDGIADSESCSGGCRGDVDRADNVGGTTNGGAHGNDGATGEPNDDGGWW